MGKQSLNRQRVALLIVGAVLAVTCTATAAHAQQPPPLPHAFFGSVEVNGQPAPVGASIEARGAGVKIGILVNPLVTTVAGRYGQPGLSKSKSEPDKLGVQGSIEDGAPIEFYVDGVKAECAAPGGPWQSSFPFAAGAVTELNLRAGQSATPTATQQSAAAGTPSPTSTSTVIPAGGNTPRADSPAPTATRQTPQAAGGGTSPQPTAGSGTPGSQPPTPVAQPTGPQKVLITQPTQLASQSTTPMQSPTPAAPSATAQAAPPSPTATQEALPTSPPASATPAAVANASASTPRPTSKPIIPGDAQASTQSSPDQSVPESGAGLFGGLLAPLGGGAVLVIAAVVAGVIVLRRRSG
jgi:hypothetical protein